MRRAICLLILLCSNTLFAAGDWSQFRGPNGDGDAGDAKLAVEFGENKNVRWKTPIEGKGWSSPIISGNRIWLTTAPEDGRKMWLAGLDLETGKIVHNILVFTNDNPQYCHPMNSYATPTPVAEGNRIFVHFGVHGTACVDAKTEKIIWSRRDFQCNHFRGPASSPIIDGDKLIVPFDGFDVQYVVALNKNTGETIWKHNREFDFQTNNGDDKKAYSTPHVIEAHGVRQLIVPAAVATESLDPETGKQLWFVRYGGMNASTRPLLAGGWLILSNGMGRVIAMDPAKPGSGEVTDTNIVWDLTRSMPRRSSPVLVDGLLYMVSDNGVATCTEAKTGEAVWSERLDGREYAASPIHASGKIYFFSAEGVVNVIEAGRQFKMLVENRFDEGFMASPAVAGNAMIVRTKTHVYRIDP